MAGEEALLFFNTDFWNDQHVEVNDLRAFVQSGQPLVDVSPEFQMGFVAVAPFSYQLRPGQGLVLVTPSPSDTPIRLGWQRSQNDGVRSLRS